MKVILKKDLKGKGKIGDILDVSESYARNVLLRSGIAEEATNTNLNLLKGQKAHEKKVLEMKEATAKAIFDKTNGKTIKITAKAGAGGKIFGSITPKDVADSILKDFGVTLDKRLISPHTGFKTVGTHEIEIKLHSEYKSKAFIEIIGE
jgi:large subunit ribosomal protein L9